MVKQIQNTLGHLFSQFMAPITVRSRTGSRVNIGTSSKLAMRLIIGLFCSSLFSVAHSASSSDVISVSTPPLEDANRLITLSIKPTQVMLGEPVTVTIVGEHRANLFAGLDWRRFEKNFVLYDVDSDSERIKVTLYPLQSGLLKTKGQTAGRMILPDIEINVIPNPEVSIRWVGPNAISMTALYAHQQAVWKAEVEVTDTAHKVTYEQRAPAINSSVTTYLQSLPVDSQATFLGDEKEHQTSAPSAKTETLVASYEVKEWQNSVPQRVLLHSPVVVVKNRSNRRWYFFDKPSSVILNPLPNFLPLTVPVGSIDWQSEPTDKIHRVGDLHYWSWQLQGRGLTPAYMNSVAHQLVAQIGHDPQIEWLSDSRETSMEFTRNGLQSTLSLRLPYRVIQPGLVALPALQLRYFNPHSEKLEVILHPEKKLLALPPWIVWIGQGLLLMLLGVLIFISLLSLKQAWLNWRLKRVIEQADSVEGLWQGLVEWRQNQSYQAWSLLKRSKKTADKVRSEQISKQLTQSKQSLGQWSQWYIARFGGSEAFAALLKELDFILYARPEQIGSEEWQRLSKKALAWSRTLSWWQLPMNAIRTRLKPSKSDF